MYILAKYFGILLIKAGSYRMELTICMLTVFTISAFAFVLADIDAPYHGFFRVDLSVFLRFVEHLDGKDRDLETTAATGARANGVLNKDDV